MTQPAVAIVNPASSGGRTLKRLPGIEDRLRETFGTLEVLRTETRGHASLLCRRALEAGASTIVSVGGDGTNNEVLAGFMDGDGNNRFPGVTLALVASGTGSDFQRTLADAWDGDEPHRVDYGVARFVDHEGHGCVRPFLNEASAGISGVVDYHVGRSNKMLGPAGSYIWGGIKAITGYRNKRVRLSVDGETPRELDLSLAVAANGQYFGGGMHAAPMARVDDGELLVLVAEGLGRFAMIVTLARLFSARHLGRPGITHRAGRRLVLEPVDSSDVVLLDVDGEQPGRLPATLEIVPAGILLRRM